MSDVKEAIRTELCKCGIAPADVTDDVVNGVVTLAEAGLMSTEAATEITAKVIERFDLHPSREVCDLLDNDERRD
jgi:hypothetical protein